MKRLFALALIFGAFVGTAQAQAITPTNSGDSLTNADTVNLIQQIRGEWASVAFQVVVSKASGTVAGTARFQGSIDGTNYVDINTDTLALSDQATNTKIWVDTGANYLYYRVNVITSGTQSSAASGSVFRRKQSR